MKGVHGNGVSYVCRQQHRLSVIFRGQVYATLTCLQAFQKLEGIFYTTRVGHLKHKQLLAMINNFVSFYYSQLNIWKLLETSGHLLTLNLAVYERLFCLFVYHPILLSPINVENESFCWKVPWPQVINQTIAPEQRSINWFLHKLNKKFSNCT